MKRPLKVATRYPGPLRERLGLLPLDTQGAGGRDVFEVTGEPTDLYKVEASKAFGVEYSKVTPEMRSHMKKVIGWGLYRG